MATPTPGDDPTLELPVPAPPAGPALPAADDTVPYPPYPPQPPPVPSPVPPVMVPPRPRSRGCLLATAIAAATAVLLVLAAVALLAKASDSADEELLREAADVELTECSPTGAGQMAATVRITNHSSKRSNYVVDIVFESSDGARQLTTRSVIVNDLEPGQVTQQQASTLAQSPGDFDCRVSQVLRFSDEG
jgi:hypothetical protein